MAAGVRIRPRPDREVPDSAMVVVRDVTRPLPAPADGSPLEAVQPNCSICNPAWRPGQPPLQHLHKTYHIQLRDGTAIVSDGVWRSLCMLADSGGFEYVNPVPHPPKQQLAISATGAKVSLVEKVVLPIR